MSTAMWFDCPSRQGRTEQLLEWVQAVGRSQSPSSLPLLIFAATGDRRLQLETRLRATVGLTATYQTATPLGFIQQEVELFWPWLRLSQAPNQVVFLPSESEQVLASQVWQGWLNDESLLWPGTVAAASVRRCLDLLLLAGLAGVAIPEIPQRLQAVLPASLPPAIVPALQTWVDWCLAQGLLSYGLAALLYSQDLWPLATYRDRLSQRFSGCYGDDVDEYPALLLPVFQRFQAAGWPWGCTFNPLGRCREGQGADPEAWQAWASAIGGESPAQRSGSVGLSCWQPALQASLETADGLDTAAVWSESPFSSLQTVSRGQLLRQVAETIAQAVENGVIQPQEIAIVGPGIDAIARYTLIQILEKRGIAVRPLAEQRRLPSSALVRSLLTLLAFLQPGLGLHLRREAVAEMLTTLSDGAIDAVRAGLMADVLYLPQREQPQLLAVTAAPRWDRFGDEAIRAYESILDWLHQAQTEPSALGQLEAAAQQFLPRDRLSLADTAHLRRLLEVADHHWQLQAVLGTAPEAAIAGRFYSLVMDGTFAADPFPESQWQPPIAAVTLATLYQYRMLQAQHRWQFWLDIGSPLWERDQPAYYGYAAFLRHPPHPFDPVEAAQTRLLRCLADLLARAGDRIILCHSDLAVSGQEQAGPLLALLNQVPQEALAGKAGC
ncbi:hypothetical protein [Synechococcus elongatus]|uniref:Uncharacterized protein n=1 Tax=Synechococcus elongatus (strain ATCC 33912 / PCC 7942 / FACHB-805) TaxID=1140 RepID=Q31PJ7_SYNE7|nr:hypothetical protein [Synechococcus elongatus]ABB57022.1 conserved hypothetical protein [Synechococcus elongatus PCC 7942 = FACHB-805]AJD58457.1 hypothetical protein M744_11740 [Synechococcus elongatus UTEX 2973]MBD2587424.1 hypothetical protein [Synechococcus elongatus FACHB-242]MBD2688797.1 hypothetical protein [Synechococcus elongatus FACHB-1061]MBD2707868.1 hypothetical protein [Synechococcus elongatus PCC 7942 = FACHB-805]